MQRFMVPLLFVATILGSTLGSSGVSNPSGKAMDPLTNLGEITTKLVTALVESEDEKVDIYAMANLVTSMSKAATIVEHPNVSRFKIIDFMCKMK